MLKLSVEQIQVFRNRAFAGFLERTRLLLKTEAPELFGGCSESETEDRILSLIKRAQAYGCFSERQIWEFCAVAIALHRLDGPSELGERVARIFEEGEKEIDLRLLQARHLIESAGRRHDHPFAAQ